MKKNNNSNIKSLGGNKTKKGMIYTKEIMPQSHPQQIIITIHDKPKSANRKHSDITPNPLFTNDNITNNTNNNINSTNNNQLLKPFDRTICTFPKKAPIQKRNKQFSDKELTDPFFQRRNIELFTKSEDNTSTYKPDCCYSNFITDGYNKRNDEHNQCNNNYNKDKEGKEKDRPLLIRTIDMLQFYIKTIKEIYESKLCSIMKKHKEELARLKNEKECLIKANNHLKTKIIEIIYLAKIYDYNEEKRCCDINKTIIQVIRENVYLRKANEVFFTFNKGGCKREDEGRTEEIERDTDNALGDDKGVIENKKEESKGKHKRQRTQFKFNNESNDSTNANMSTNNNSNSNTNNVNVNRDNQLPQHSTTSIISNDSFKESIMEINKLSKTMKRLSTNSDDNSNNINKDQMLLSPIPIINKKQPLCYITPSGKDNKKLIEFTQ